MFTAPEPHEVEVIRSLLEEGGRRDEAAFIAEGPWGVERALLSGYVRYVVASTELGVLGRSVADKALELGKTIYQVDHELFCTFTVETIPAIIDAFDGIMAVCEIPRATLGQVFESEISQLLVFENADNVGNVGAAIRSADAAGATAVILAGNCADPFIARATRTSTGSIFSIPIVTGVSVAEVIAAANDRNVTTAATAPLGECTLFDDSLHAALRRPVAWFFGNEVKGLEPETMDLLDYQVRIPMFGKAESLNLSVSVAICLYTTLHIRHLEASGDS